MANIGFNLIFGFISEISLLKNFHNILDFLGSFFDSRFAKILKLGPHTVRVRKYALKVLSNEN
jgi:hypothetical protein